MKKQHQYSFAVRPIFLILMMAALVIQVLSHGNRLGYSSYDKYTEMWKKVEQYEKEGLPASALEVVEQILTVARLEKNSPQTYKAYVHKMKFEYQTKDNGMLHVINSLRSEIVLAPMPVKAFLQSLYAELLWGYYLQNRWTIMNRTFTADFVPEDIATWDARRLNDEISEHYLKSLEKVDDLKKVNVKELEEILKDFDKSSGLRTNAYDLLAQRALSYFTGTDAYLTDPSNTFRIDDAVCFSPARTFALTRFASGDTDSRKLKVLTIFQNLIMVHLNDKNPETLVDIDIQRLKYVRQNAVMQDADTLYYNALADLQEKFSSHQVRTVIDYEIASFLKNKGSAYNHFTNPEVKDYLKHAYELCGKTSEKFPNAPFTQNLLELRKEISNISFSLRSEQNVLPARPVLLHISYKNINKLYFKILDVSQTDLKEKTVGRNDSIRLSYYNSLPSFRDFEVSLIDEKDFQQHSTEIILDPLPLGKYLIMASPDPSFKYNENKVDLILLNTTTISYVYQRNQDYSYVFHMLHRENGSPLQGVRADVFYEEYNYNRHRYENKRLGTWTSDANGEFTLPASKKWRTLSIDFSRGNDKLQGLDEFYQYEYYGEKKRKETRTVFFTDRAIYRPGQTLYFKGIVYETDGENNSIKTNFSTTVSLFDANYQKVSDLELTTNEFGSFHGEFVLPEGGITGQMFIRNPFGSVYFRMEEYKRPKFEVSFEPLEKFFRLNEKIEAVGVTQAYAGYAVDGAKVSYSITRSAYYPYRYYWWWYPPAPAATVIKQGELITDAEGKFVIDFIAEPDPGVKKKYLPAFIYSIQADVTDINGETRSSSMSVRVGYKSMLLSSDLGEFFNPVLNDTVIVQARNLSGNPLPADVKMIIQTVEPKSYQIKRPWEKPDRPLVTQEAFRSAFPLLPWDDEDNPSTWKKGNLVFERMINTEKESKVAIKGSEKWDPGWYYLKLTSVDPFGETVEHEHYFRVYHSKQKKADFQDVFWVIPEKTGGEPGEKAVFLIGSSAPDAQVLISVEHKGKTVQKEYRFIGKGITVFEIPIRHIHRGGFSVHMSMVQHNRVYTKYFPVYVPHTDKQLDIRFETFRDKLLPGQEEEWKLVISGSKGEKAMAEMAAVLYDASLEAFASHYWSLYLNYYDYSSMFFNTDNTFGNSSSFSLGKNWYSYVMYKQPVYEYLNTFGLSGLFGYYREYSYDSFFGGADQEYDYDVAYFRTVSAVTGQAADRKESMPQSGVVMNGVLSEDERTMSRNEEQTAQRQVLLDGDKGGESDFDNVELRSDFSETAFFYPQLRTNENGEIVISFTVPESLTRWKMMGFAHTTDLKTGNISKELVTQKDLMVVPNLPRFFRENDQMILTAKITNLTEELQEGKAKLMFFDAFTMQPVDKQMENRSPEVSFKALPGQSADVSWTITIPAGISALTCRIVASSGKHTDGEEHTLPVLVNKMLVTESLPLPVRSNQTKVFRHEKLINSSKSTTLRHHSLTLEFTANPAWYAVQALPYIMEYPYECAEQIFSRYYANILATYVVNSKPEIKKVFDEWMKYPDSDALLSNLEKNQELKALVLEETPWVREAKNESERKRRVALLFDFNKMSKESDRALRKLKKMQKPGGGWVWFEGFPPDRYITQHIIAGFGHLDHLNVMKVKDKQSVWSMVRDGISFIDSEIGSEYENLKRRLTPAQMEHDNLSYMATHYLYTRSFFNQYVPVPKQSQEAVNYFMGQAAKHWLNKGLYSQGMIALSLHRNGDKVVPGKILKSLNERSIKNEEMGMFWQQNTAGYYWWQAPIETQAILIEAFYEIGTNTQIVDDLKTWLLKQKQVQDWKTTKATVDAVYVLLLTGTDWLSTEPDIEITVGDQVFDLKNEKNIEAGTGYFKTSWNQEQIRPAMGNVQVVKRDEGVSWGALYWQYFEQLDKITTHETPLKINKKLFIERVTDKGKHLEELKDGGNLSVGDKVIVRIELRTDRDMEYVHMKDMRAAGFEPINVLSQYKWQGGIGYYESTRDAATNFFMSRLNKGTYVFEYPLRASIAGNYSNGITTVQCMYAPEFTSHSEGIRVQIKR